METYGGTFDELGLVLRQLKKYIVVAVADIDVLRAANPAQIAAAKETVEDSKKVYIFLEKANGQR